MEMTKQKNRSIYHWAILVCCILILMFSYSTRVGLAQLFATEILKETGFSSGAYFLSTTLTSVACAISGPIAGKLLRGKYMRTTFVLCSIGTMGSYACYGLCHSLWQFYIVGTLVGVFAMGCGTLLVSVLITNWFEKNRGLMISIAMMGISIGGTVLSPLLSWLIVEFGWRNAYFILSALSLIVLIPIGLFVVRRTPQDAGLEPYGHGEESTASAKKKNVPASNWNATLKEARQTPILWMFALGAFLIYFTACIMQHQSYYLQGVGFDAASIASYISLYSVVAIIGKLVLGRIFDRFGPKIGILFGSGTFLLFLVGFLFVQGSPMMLYFAAVMYGFGTCTATVAIPIMTTSVFGAKNYSELYGFISAFTMAGSAIGSSAIGFLYDLTGSYRPALTVLAILTALTIVIMFVCINMGQKHVPETSTNA